MRSYERVTFRPEGERARSVYLENPTEVTMLGAPVLNGREVGKDGEDVLNDRSRTRIIGLDLIVKREPYEMDLRYAELVPAGTAAQPIQP